MDLGFTEHNAALTMRSMSLVGKPDRSPGQSYLDGQFLVAMPSMTDPRFERTVIYVCAHTADGAMGIVINKVASHISFPELLVQLEIIPDGQAIRLPEPANRMRVHKGGPVETGRGFVLHTSDFRIENSTLPIDDSVCLTATLDILKAIARGRGPRQALLALGYAGWSAGQLESELQANGWLHCPADIDLLFDADLEHKYERALKRIGIDLSHLSSQAGRA